MPLVSVVVVGTRSDCRVLEDAIAGVIADVLDVPSVGMSDDPFELGLTSIRAIRICARMRRDFDLDAEPEWLLDSESVADFVAVTLGTRDG